MRFLEKVIFILLVIALFSMLSFSDARFVDIPDRVHILASEHGFDFFSWISNASWIKLTQSAVASPGYFQPGEQHRLVIEYLRTVRDIENTSHSIDLMYSDPSVSNPQEKSAALRQQLQTLTDRQNALAPFAEAILERQVTVILNEEGLTNAGQPIPWVLYHVTPLPQNLVLSRRDVIGQITNYVLTPITVEQASDLESKVDKQLNVSSLVVDIGGLAAYPTMIERTTALDWLTSTIAHEWTHIYLGQHPLGNNYDTAELRTMNETTASISGGEIGKLVMQRYYPELLAEDAVAGVQLAQYHTNGNPAANPPFDYRAEMHTTRVHADQLLAQGKIDEAEAYMEQRRQFFWDNHYPMRKLNQAYFAFYGSYADTPGGAAGEDPVGPAVRALRARSSSLKDFLERISEMTSFAQLKQALAAP